MPESQEKIKQYFEEKRVKIATKIEKTPMERFFVFFLIIIAISAVVLSIFQFKKNIDGPLVQSYLDLERGKIRQKYDSLNVNSTQSDITRLQNQDSDLDGLSDYSEQYLYKTNSYLEDSDGDGVWDKQEIVAGTDPNCPAGQQCDFAQTLPGIETSPTEVSTDVMDQAQEFLDLQQQLLSGEVTLEELGLGDIAGVTSGDKTEALDNVKDWTPEQIRQELIKQGFDANTLEQIDDQTLMDVFGDVLKSYQ